MVIDMTDDGQYRGSQEADAYWGAVAEGRLILQRCNDCGSFQFYPRVFCLKCEGRGVGWVPASGDGTLHAFAIVHQAPGPDFVKDIPYVAAIVELAEGPRMPTRLTGVAPEPSEIEIGMALRVTFSEVNGRPLPVFRPA